MMMIKVINRDYDLLTQKFNFYKSAAFNRDKTNLKHFSQQPLDLFSTGDSSQKQHKSKTEIYC